MLILCQQFGLQRTVRMKKRNLLYVVTALLFLCLCFLLVHNAALHNPLPSGGELLKRLMPASKGNATADIYVKPTAKIVELQLGEKIVRYKKNLENLDYVDTIRRPRKLPIVKADNRINAVVDANNMKKNKLSVDELEPPDHLDAVRMEQDGHLNRDYKKEIFIGNHEELDKVANKEEVSDKLQDIFEKVDLNRDKRIVESELEAWILQKIEEHFEEAEEENESVFKSLDEDMDGFISWQEFHYAFLVALGHDETAAQKHVHDYETLKLPDEDAERLIRYKFKWAEADQGEIKDNKLTMEEFQMFRHPEQSQAMLETMVKDITDSLDQNHDGLVDEEEFVSLQSYADDNNHLPPQGQHNNLQEERRKEFRNSVDIDHDGKATRDELMNYIDPQNPNHAKSEARTLIELGDSNHDGKLSFSEILDNVDLFLGSKMVNTGRSFHDEF